MTEPAGPVSFSLLAVAIAALGPVLGPYALIIFAAGIGAMVALSTHKADPEAPRWAGVKYVAMGTLIALMLTGPCIWLVMRLFPEVPANIALIPVAFVLGLARNKLVDLINLALDGIAATTGAIFNRGPKGGGQ